MYTIGKRGSAADFRTAADALAARGVEIVTIPRGGETTYHGPGQLVVYPIVSLRPLGVGARAYVEGLEDVVVRTLGRYGIAARVSTVGLPCRPRCPCGWCEGHKGSASCVGPAVQQTLFHPCVLPFTTSAAASRSTPLQGRVPGKTGVWVGERKIGAIGVRISQGVTSHGAALNVSTDLSAFQHIVPCGTPDKEVTSIHRQLAAGQPWRQEVQQQASQQDEAQRLKRQLAAQGLAGAAAASGAAPPLQAPSMQQVADCLLDDFAAHFGFTHFEPLPDVCQLAADLGCYDASPS